MKNFVLFGVGDRTYEILLGGLETMERMDHAGVSLPPSEIKAFFYLSNFLSTMDPEKYLSFFFPLRQPK